MQKKILLALIALTFAFAPATAERIKHEDKIIEAITLMDEGKYAPSIRILRDVLATDSTNYHARYELGYAYYLAGNYRQSAAMYEPSTIRKPTTRHSRCLETPWTWQATASAP